MIATPQQLTPDDARPDLVGLLPEEADAAIRAHFAARGQPARQGRLPTLDHRGTP